MNIVSGELIPILAGRECSLHSASAARCASHIFGSDIKYDIIYNYSPAGECACDRQYDEGIFN